MPRKKLLEVRPVNSTAPSIVQELESGDDPRGWSESFTARQAVSARFASQRAVTYHKGVPVTRENTPVERLQLRIAGLQNHWLGSK